MSDQPMPSPPDDEHGVAEPAATIDQTDEEARPPTQATILTEIGQEADLWHDPDGVAWATITIGVRQEHHEIRTKGFRTWLRRRFYEQQGKSASSQAVQDAVENLAGIAEFDGETHPVNLRIAEHQGAFYLDLADDDWRAVRITADGWEVVARPPVKFQRRNGMLPLPAPETGGTLDDLRQFVNVSDDDWILVKAWLAAALRPSGPYPVLNLIGQQGSGKSTTARVLRRLIDPNVADVRRAPSNERDLIIAASNGQIVSLENLSWLPAWLSDALAALATGSGFAARTLYENNDETIFSACRPIILNGIEEVAVRPDLLDRSILVNHPTIGDAKRSTEEQFWEAFYEARPQILGAICDVVVAGLGRRHLISPERLPRMADFAIWSMACAPALGNTMAEFVQAYSRNQHSAHSLALEESPVGLPIRDLVVDTGGWEGAAGELLELLTTDEFRRMKAWPKSGQQMAGAIKRIAPALLDANVEVAYDKNARRWTFTRLGSSKSAMSGGSAEKDRTPRTHRTSTSTQSPDCDGCGKPATSFEIDGTPHCDVCKSWTDVEVS